MLYSQRYLCHHLEFWWREYKRMELLSNGTRSSLDGCFHESFPSVFGKWKAPIMSTLTQSENTLSTLAILNPSRSKWGMTLPSGSLLQLSKFIIPNIYSTGTLYFGRLWSSFLQDKTKMLIANKVPAKHHWSPEACLQFVKDSIICYSALCRVLQKK